MKLKIILLQDEDTSKFSTTFSGRSNNSKYISSTKNEFVVIYNLNEICPTTNTFINLVSQELTCSPEFRYNIYKTFDPLELPVLKEKMNSVINNLNKFDELPNIDSTLKLNVELFDPEYEKINALHVYFENTSQKFFHKWIPIQFHCKTVPEQTKEQSYNNVYNLLEDINRLVHAIEACNHGDNRYFVSLRIGHNPTRIKLTDDDFGRFIPYISWGDLLLDYYTIGKDLSDAWSTNDFALVKNKECKQQSSIHPCVSMNFGDDYGQDIDAFRHWCKVNHVSDYYDINLPMYNLGRIKLGQIDLNGFTKAEYQKNIALCTGILKVELTQ